MLGRRWLARWVHSDSLIKNLTPFEDDAEICLLNFLMYPDSQKILLSRTSPLEFTETNSYFYSFTYEKTAYLAVSSCYQWVDVFVNLLAGRKAVDSTPEYSLLA